MSLIGDGMYRRESHLILIEDGWSRRAGRSGGVLATVNLRGLGRVVRFLLLSSLFLACNRTPQSVPDSAPRSSADPAVEVKTIPLRRGTIVQVISASGSVVARRVSQVGAEVTGRIVRVHVSEGDRVESGAPLFEVDSVPYTIALRQAEAMLDVARAERQQTDSDLQRARTLRRQ